MNTNAKVHPYKSLPIDETTLNNGSKIPVFSSPDKYTNNYEVISMDHSKHFEETGHNPFMGEEFWIGTENIIINLVQKWTPSGERILDVGCGMGRLLSKLNGYEKYGMDISKTYLNYASTTDVSLCLAKLEDAPYEDNFFDAIICTDVLEHVLDLNFAITQLFRMLRKDGFLYIRVPYKENLAQYLTDDYPYQFAHLRNFDDNSLKLLFERIFNQKIIAVEKGPFIRGGAFQKIKFEFKGLAMILRTFFRILRLYDKDLERQMESSIYDPVEISLVIQKIE